VLQEDPNAKPQDPVLSGWYVDPRTGQRVFYDSTAGKFFYSGGRCLHPIGYMNPAPKQVAVAPGDKLK